MEKHRAYYTCDHCGHERVVLVYEEDSWAAATHGTAESNRERHRQVIESTCERCGKAGFSPSSGSAGR